MAALARRARRHAGSPSRCRRRRPTSAPATTASALAPGADQPDRARGPRLEPRRDRADRRRRGRGRADRATATTASCAGSRRPCARPAASCPTASAGGSTMHNEIPLARGLGSSAAATVGRASWPATRSLGEPLTTPSCSGSPTDIEGHPDNAAAALLGGFVVSAAGRRTASRPSASTRRATCGPSCSSRSCACRPTTMRAALPGRGPARRRGRQPRRRSRSASPGWRPAGSTCCAC